MAKKTREITEKEKVLIQLIAEGYIDAEIKEKLNVSGATIRNWLEKAYIKTATINRPHLVYWAAKNNILS